MGDFPSGQRGQTVNLLAMPSVVRIHHPPPTETTIVIRTPRCWTTMVVFVFALQIAAFSSRTFLIQLDIVFQTPENPCRNSEKCAIRTPLSKSSILGNYCASSIILFFLHRCLVMQSFMGSLRIIEINIPVYCRSEFPFRAVFISIQFFSFHRSEERLHHRIIVRYTRL